MSLTNRVAVVTGASSGMGKMSAIRLAEKGVSVAALDIDKNALIALESEHKNIAAFPCDITNQQQVADTIDQVETSLGPIYRITHAAGVMPMNTIVDMPVEMHAKEIEIEDDYGEGEEGHGVEIEGMVTSEPGPDGIFTINGQMVMLGDYVEYQEGLSEDSIVMGAILDVEGNLDENGVLIIKQVEAPHHDDVMTL